MSGPERYDIDDCGACHTHAVERADGWLVTYEDFETVERERDEAQASYWAKTAALEDEIKELRRALDEVQETLNGINSANWREWGDLADPEQFVGWAKSRARHALSRLPRAGG